MTRQNPASRSAWSTSQLRDGLLLLSTALLLTTCTEGPGAGPLGPAPGGVRIGLVPQFHSFSSTASSALNRVRLTVLNSATRDTLHREIQNIDPADDSWTLTLQFTLPSGEGAADVVVLLELLADDVVEWSGKTAPIAVKVGSTNQQTTPVPLYQGPPANLEVAGVEITTTPAPLLEGDSVRLVAVVSPASLAAQVFWRSLTPEVATVSSTGVVRTLRDGTAQIEASAGPRSAAVSIAVRQRPASVRVTPAEIEVASLRETVQFGAEVLDPRGGVIAGSGVSWSSADPERARSHGDGSFTVLANGSVSVTATSLEAPTLSGSARIRAAQHPTVITFATGPVSFTAVGESVRLQPQARDANGNEVTGASYSWSSSDAGVASVDGDGTVQAVANGSTTITASFPATGASASVSVTVKQAVSAVRVEPSTLTFTAIGETAQLSGQAVDRNGNPMPDAITWSSSDPGVVAVDGSGLARAVAAGSASIEGSAGAVRGSVAVRVAPVVTSMEISPAGATLNAIGATLTFTASGTDRNNNKTVVLASWSSSNAAVATIDENGVATAVGNGATTITARQGEVTATASLVVLQTAASVTLSPDSILLVGPGASASFTAIVRDARGHAIVGAPLEWTSQDPAIATVDGEGKVTGVKSGVTEIVARSGTATGTGRAVVKGFRVQVDPRTVTLTSTGATTQLSVTVTDGAGQPVARPASWSSRNGAVAAVDDAGTVTAVGRGSTYVVATVGEDADSALVTVEPVAARLSLSPPRDSIQIGGRAHFDLLAFDAAGAPVAVQNVTWSSSDETVATVDDSGNATGVGAGIAGITATAGQLSATAVLRVRGTVDLAVKDLTVTPPDTVDLGGTIVIGLIVQNLGTEDSPPTTLLVRAVNAATGATGVDTVLSVPALSAGGGTISAARSIAVRADDAWPVAVRVQVLVDPQNTITETVETNNSAESGTIVVRGATPPAPGAGLHADVIVTRGQSVLLTSALTSPVWSTASNYTASVDASGRVYGNEHGAVEIYATSGAAVDTTLVWVVPAGYTRAWVGRITGTQDWQDPTQWLPAGIPTAADHVFIPDCGTYYYDDCVYPQLTNNAIVGSISTGIAEYAASRVELPARPARPDRATRLGLKGETLAAYNVRQAELDRSRLGAARSGGTVARNVRGSGRTAPASAANTLASAQLYGWYHVDTNGYILEVQGDLNQFVYIGSQLTAPGLVRFVGNNQVVAGADITADVEVPATNLHFGGGGYYSYTWIEGDLTITGSAVIDDVSAGGDVLLSGGLDVTGWLEIDGSAMFDGATAVLADFWASGSFQATNSDISVRGSGTLDARSAVLTDTQLQFGTFADMYIWEGNLSFIRSTISGAGYFSLDVSHNLTLDASTYTVGAGDIYLGYYDSGIPGYVGGNLTLQNAARLDLNGDAYVLGYGTLDVRSSSRISMTDPNANLNMNHLVFDGASTAGYLTAGELQAHGNLTVGTSSPTAFSPSGAHVTSFGNPTSADGMHTVVMPNVAAGTAGNHFAGLEAGGGSIVVLPSGTMLVEGAVIMGGELRGDIIRFNGEVAVTGSVHANQVDAYDDLSGSWTVGTLNVHATGGNLPNQLTGNLVVKGAPYFYGTTITGDLLIEGATAAFEPMGSGTTVSGNLTVRDGGRLGLVYGGASVLVAGGVSTANGGYLKMDVAGTNLSAGGALRLYGAANVMQAGTIMVAGNVEIGAGIYQAAPAHLLWLAGTGAPQTITPADAVFGDLTFENPAGIQIVGGITVADRFTADMAAPMTISSASGSVIRAGNAVITNGRFDHVALDLGSSSSAPGLALNNITFQNMGGIAVPQLNVLSGTTTPINVNTITFDPVAGSFYARMDGVPGTELRLNTASDGTASLPSATRFAGSGTIYWNGTAVHNPLAVTLAVSPGTAALAIGQTVSLVATVTGTTNTAVTYGSSNPGVATVNASTGVVTGVTAGSATITASSAADPSVTATVAITVVSSALATCAPQTGGDMFSRGFYLASYPGTALKSVQLYVQASAAGTYDLRLTARSGAYDGAVIGSADTRVVLGTDVQSPVLFSFGDIEIAAAATVTFVLEQVGGPSSFLYYAITNDTSCPITQTEGTTPPLDTSRGRGVGIVLIG